MFTLNNQKINVSQFNGGEINVRLPNFHLTLLERHARYTLTAILKSPADQMALPFVVDALRRAYPNMILELLCPYFPYARQDRVCNPGESLAVKVFADLVNRLDFNRVQVWDPHSDVTPALLNRVEVRHQGCFVKPTEHILTPDLVFVAPDAGALKKTAAVADAFNRPMISATKTRSMSDGKILGVDLVNTEINADAYYLIVDDICDGGGTFIALAELLRERGAKRVGLHVTHGIFSRGFSPFKGLIDTITFTNSRGQKPSERPDFLHRVQPDLIELEQLP